MTAILAALLSGAGCSGMARVEVVLPRPERAGGGGAPEKCLVIAAISPHCEAPAGRSAREELESLIEKALAGSGRYEVIESDLMLPFDLPPPVAASVAWRAGASRLALLRLHHLEVRTRTHHVREYHDADAGGELFIIDAARGSIIQAAEERMHVSMRARYSSPGAARGEALSRLARGLSRQLFEERPGQHVDLADPRGGALRPGIELAKKGRWDAAIESWSRFLATPALADDARHNIEVASELLGSHDRQAP